MSGPGARLCCGVALLFAFGCGADKPPTGGGGGGGFVADSGAATDAAQDVAVADTGTTDTGVRGPDDASSDGSIDAAVAVDAGPVDTGPKALGYDEVHTKLVVTLKCNGGYCHGSGAGGLTMSDKDVDASYANLMKGVASGLFKDDCTKPKYVVAGKPDDSLLWLKIDANSVHGCGNKMPSDPGSKGAPAAVSALVKKWIIEGAVR